MANISFRNSKIVYYGPHECNHCGVLVCRMGIEWGHNAFTYPEGPVYPNTEWYVHVCDPKNVHSKRAWYAKKRVKETYPNAVAIKSSQQGWMILDGDSNVNKACGAHTFIDSEDQAWIDAKSILYPNEGESK